MMDFILMIMKCLHPAGGFTYLEGDLKIYCNVSDDHDGGWGLGWMGWV